LLSCQHATVGADTRAALEAAIADTPWQHPSSSLASLVLRCIHIDPARRPTASETAVLLSRASLLPVHSPESRGGRQPQTTLGRAAGRARMASTYLATLLAGS